MAVIEIIMIIVAVILFSVAAYSALKPVKSNEPKLVKINVVDDGSDGVKSFMALTVPLKANYGVMYGLISWDEEGASVLYDFLNNQIWRKGYKVEHFDVEHAQIGGSHVAFVMGIVRPKTIIDRILY
ncbi:MAG: hypothetical protein QXP81_10705 [Nitrososphaerota archaeon]